VTSAVVRSQLCFIFGSTNSKALISNFIITVLKSISAGQPDFKTPPLANAKRYLNLAQWHRIGYTG
jgi:hypothetical protein